MPTSPVVETRKTPVIRIAAVVLAIILVLALIALIVRYGKRFVLVTDTVTPLTDSVELDNGPVPEVSPGVTSLPSAAPQDFANASLFFRSPSALVKRIEGTEYVFLPGTYSAEYDKQLAIVDDQGEPQASKDPFLSALGSYISNRTVDFWIDTKNNEFFIVDAHPESADHSNTLMRLQFERNQDGQYFAKSKTIVFYQPVASVYEISRIIDKPANGSSLLLSNSSGDGCGGAGQVWSVDIETHERTDILSHAVGCADGPSYGGLYKDGRLIVAERKPMAEYNLLALSQTVYTSLYLLNPATMEKEVLTTDSNLFDGHTLFENSRSYYQDVPLAMFEGKIVFVKPITDNQNIREAFTVYNPETKQIEPLFE